MKTIFSILYKPSSTFDELDEKYEDDLNANGSLILIILGLVLGADTFFKENVESLDLINIVLVFGLSIGVSLIFGKYVLTYPIYWIGKLLKGTSELVDIRSVVAYSLVPRIFMFPVILYFEVTGKYDQISGLESNLNLALNILVSLMTIIILFKGLLRFNGYGYIKAFLNVSPFLLYGLVIYLYVLLK